MRYRLLATLLAGSLLLCASIRAGEEVSVYESRPNGDPSVRVSVGAIIPAALLESVAVPPSPGVSYSGFRPVSVELRLRDRLITVLQYLQPESNDQHTQGFHILAAAVEPGAVVLVCAVGSLIDVQRIPVLEPQLRQHLLLRFVDWSAGNEVRPLAAGDVTSTLRRAESGNGWLIEVIDRRAVQPRRSLFRQAQDGWKFQKVQ